MNIKKVIRELKKKYPGKKIIHDAEAKPTEIIVELEPATDDPEKSLALEVWFLTHSKPGWRSEDHIIVKT